MTDSIYCTGIGDQVRVVFDESIRVNGDASVEVYTGKHPVAVAINLCTIETAEGQFLSINPTTIKAINWCIDIDEAHTVIRLFLADAVADLDPLKKVNQQFFNRVFSENWEQYLTPHHKQQLQAQKTAEHEAFMLKHTYGIESEG